MILAYTLPSRVTVNLFFYHHHVFHIIIYVSDVDMIIPKHDSTV